MSNKRTHDEYRHRHVLRRNGWDVPKTDAVAFNSGSETPEHYFAKCVVAYVLKDQGYRIATEVEKEGVGEIDVIAYGTEDEPIAVEVETNPSDEVVKDKLSRYVQGEPYRDMFLLNVDEMPATWSEAIDWVEGEL